MDGEVVEVDAAGDEADDRHDDVVDERVDDGVESATDRHTDGEVDDGATIDKFDEFVADIVVFLLDAAEEARLFGFGGSTGVGSSLGAGARFG